jgi:hypothetical protein
MQRADDCSRLLE